MTKQTAENTRGHDREAADLLVGDAQTGGNDGAGDEGTKGDGGRGAVRYQPACAPHPAEHGQPDALGIVLADAAGAPAG